MAVALAVAVAVVAKSCKAWTFNITVNPSLCRSVPDLIVLLLTLCVCGFFFVKLVMLYAYFG